MGNRIVYADILRILATIAVMIIHVSATNFGSLSPHSYEWNVLNIYDSLVRWCVPMFAMLSGMFFLNPDKTVSLKKLYTKYIYRIVLALLVWGFIYQLYKGILNHTIDSHFLKKTILLIVHGETHYHLWFLYMILGLYIITPILRTFIQAAKKKDIEYFLMISFIFTSLIPTVHHFYPFNHFTPFLIKFDVHLVLGYALYYVIGYYLSQYDLSTQMKKCLYTLGILSLFATVIGTSMLSLGKGSPDTFLYNYLRVNVFFTSIALFTFVKEFFSKKHFNKPSLYMVSVLSKYSFGMYLVHDMVRTLLMKVGLDNLSFNPIISVPIIAVCIFIISFFATFLIKRIPYVGERIT